MKGWGEEDGGQRLGGEKVGGWWVSRLGKRGNREREHTGLDRLAFHRERERIQIACRVLDTYLDRLAFHVGLVRNTAPGSPPDDKPRALTDGQQTALLSPLFPTTGSFERLSTDPVPLVLFDAGGVWALFADPQPRFWAR